MFNFEKLDTWNEAIAFADIVYELPYGAAEKQSRMLSGLKKSLETR
jgi:hypothetical protein